MAHYPVNHHLRQVYRLLAGLGGLYFALVGVIGIAKTWGDPFFYQHGGDWALGLRVNPASAWLYAIVGVVLLAVVLIGGNLLHRVAIALGWGLCGISVLVMAFIQTDANVLHASMINVIVTIALGLVTLAAGLFGKVGDAGAAHAEELAAHGPR
jgi:hypothetical protein